MSEKTDPRDFIYLENRLFKSPAIWNYDYPITGYRTACMPDDSLGAAESAPEPFESNKISIFYLTRKGSGQASDSNSIPHALSEAIG